MSSGGPGNPRRTPSWEKYDRLRNDHEEREMQRGVSNIGPSNAAADEDAVVKNGDVFDIPPKNATLESLRKWRRGSSCMRWIWEFMLGSQLQRDDDDAFDIHPKHAPPESLRRWMLENLVLNAASRFQYTPEKDKRQLGMDGDNVFNIKGKHTPLDMLKHWRVATRVLTAAHKS